MVMGYAYDRCTACSPTILKEYGERGFEFLLEVFNRPGILEEVTGLKALQEEEIDLGWDDSLDDF